MNNEFVIVNGITINVKEIREEELKSQIVSWFRNMYEIDLLADDYEDFAYDVEVMRRVCRESGLLNELEVYFTTLFVAYLRYLIKFEDKNKIVEFLKDHVDEARWLHYSYYPPIE
jgi:hypothetical protein